MSEDAGARQAAEPDAAAVAVLRAAGHVEEQAQHLEEQAGHLEQQAGHLGEQADRVTQLVDGALTTALSTAIDAVAAARESDTLLLDTAARKMAAQVSAQAPFGVPGVHPGGRGDLRRGFSVSVGVLLAAVLAYSVVSVRHELVVILIAAFIAIGLDPAVRFLVGHGLSRRVSVAVIAVVALGLLGGFIALAVQPLIREFNELVAAAPGYAKDLQDQNNALGRLNAKYDLAGKVQTALKNGITLNAAGGILAAGKAAVTFTFDILVTIVLVIYFLADLPRIKDAAYRLVPLRRRPRVGLLADEIIERVGGYVLGNVATSVVAAVASYVLLLSLGVPYAFVLSVLTGILDLIPLVGASIGGAVAALVALASVSGTAAVVVVVFHVVYRLVADYLLNPLVLKRTVEVSPLVTVVAVILGGSLLGIVGALIAVPTAAGIQLILTEVVYPQRDADA